jgi:hypothetical protein
MENLGGLNTSLSELGLNSSKGRVVDFRSKEERRRLAA